MTTARPAAAGNMVAEFAVAVDRKLLDQQKQDGQSALRLIESAGPYKRPPGPDSTISVVA